MSIHPKGKLRSNPGRALVHNDPLARRVGLKVTHRVLNRLWTRNYHTGVRKARSQAIDQYPLEDNLSLLITRASVKEYGLLSQQLAESRQGGY
jgi:hypothetical protein